MQKTANYSSEFKRESVKLAQSTDKPVFLVAAELGIKVNTLYNWISKAMKEQKPLAKAKQPASHC